MAAIEDGSVEMKKVRVPLYDRGREQQGRDQGDHKEGGSLQM